MLKAFKSLQISDTFDISDTLQDIEFPYIHYNLVINAFKTLWTFGTLDIEILHILPQLI